MSALTTYLANRLASHNFGRASFTAPLSYYLGLFTSAPGVGGGGTEVSVGSYARLQINNTATVPFMWISPVNGVTSNAIALVFPVAQANWGTITHWALFDGASGGNMCFFGTVTPSKLIQTGDQFSVAISELEFTFE
jgi:hypothetical protein